MLGLPRGGDECAQQVAKHAAHLVAPVEAELHLGQVARPVLGELDRGLRTRLCRLDVADQRVDRSELLVQDAGPAAASDLSVVPCTHRGSYREAVQAIGHDNQRQQHARGDEGLQRSFCERPGRQAGQVRLAVYGPPRTSRHGLASLRCAEPTRCHGPARGAHRFGHAVVLPGHRKAFALHGATAPCAFSAGLTSPSIW